MPWVWRVAAAAVLAGACGGGSTAPAAETAYDFSFADPAGDTVTATANPAGVPAIDLLKVSGRIDANQLTITLEFAEPVSRWSDGRPDGLDGFLDFDLDESEGTGTHDAVAAIGIDAYVDLRDNGTGRLALVNVATKKVDLVDGKWSGVTFEVTIPRTLLVRQTDNDNKMFLSVQIGARGRKPLADISPNEGHHVLEPPPPAP